MKPCKECPFWKGIKPGLLGGSTPEVYVGQIVLPFWLPCHCAANYRGRETDVNAVTQCAGAAIMRANIGAPPRRGLLSLPPSPESFSSIPEFYAHHTGATLEQAQAYLTAPKVAELAQKEWNDPRVRMQVNRKAA